MFTPGDDGLEYYGRIEEIYELTFHGSKPLKPVIFKCHWFDPHAVRRTPNLGLVEVQQASVYPGDDVYIVAQQATQVYYLSYPCQTDNRLKGWDVVYKVSPHGKLPVPNNEDYNIDPNTYAGEFFQEDGLDGTFQIDLTRHVSFAAMQKSLPWVSQGTRQSLCHVPDILHTVKGPFADGCLPCAAHGKPFAVSFCGFAGHTTKKGCLP